MSKPRLLRASPALRRLLIAQVPADFADWLDYVAITALLAFHWDVPPVAFAWLGVAMGLPYLVIGPVAGLVVDRSPLLRVLILSNLGRGAVTLSFLLAGNWPVLMGLVFLRSAVDSAYTPAKQAALQALCPEEALTRANGLSHAINQASKIAAPGLGGLALSLLAPQAVFAANALISVLAAVMAVRIGPISRGGGDEAAQAPFWSGLGGGFAALKRSGSLRLAVGLMAAGYLAMFFYDTLIAPLLRDMSFDETFLDLTLAVIGAGGVLGALAMSAGRGENRPFLLIGLGTAVSGSLIVMIGVSEIAGWGVPGMAVLVGGALIGICGALTVVPVRAVIQRETHPQEIARVAALSEAANMIALLSAPFFGAALASMLSVGWAFVTGGGLGLGVAVAAFIGAKRPD